MSSFNPKETLRQAQLAEDSGRVREASSGYASLALYLRQKGKLTEARKLFKRAIRLSPKSARLYVQLALTEAKIGDISAARVAVEKFTQCALDRRKTDAYRPYLDAALDEYPELRQVFYEKLLELDRTDVDLFLDQAKLWITQQAWPQALASALQALITKQDDASSLALVESILRDSGRVKDLPFLEEFSRGRLAREDLIAALTIERRTRPTQERTEVSAASVVAPREEERGLDAMIRDLEREMGIEESLPDTVTPLVKEFRRRSKPILQSDTKSRIDLAWAFHEMGLSQDSVDELQSIDSSDRFFPEAQAALGEVFLAQGSDLGALDAFQNALRDERSSMDIVKEARYRIVQIFLRLGDPKRARLEADELEKIDPDYRDLRRIKPAVD